MDAASTALVVRSTELDLASLTSAAKDLRLARAGDRGPGSALEVAQQQALQERRRGDRERHFHGEVWTKDPHGGRHRKVCSWAFSRSQTHLLCACSCYKSLRNCFACQELLAELEGC